MEEVSKIAMAYYRASSDHQRKLARDFFGAMDHDGDGKIDQKEFIEFLIDEGYAQMTRASFFKQLDLDGNGTLDFFEVLTLYYILKSGRPFCDKCNMFIPNTYFTCVGCLEDEGGVPVHLCLECYTGKRCDHSHNGLSQYLDNYSLLEATLKSSLSKARSRPSSSAMDEVPTHQNVAPRVYHQTHIQNNYSFHHTPPHPVAGNAIVRQKQRRKVALEAFETTLRIATVGANISNMCSIL